MTDPISQENSRQDPISQENSREEILTVFNELLGRLWDRLVPLIGQTATIAIFRSALLEASGNYSFLEKIEISNSGVQLIQFQLRIESVEQITLRKGLLDFTDSVIALLIDLTAEILLRKVEPLVQQVKQKFDMNLE